MAEQDASARDFSFVRHLTLRAWMSYLSHMLRSVFRAHHRSLFRSLAPAVPRDGVVLDLGAHAGQYTRGFARLAPQGRIYAFEPSRYTRSILRVVVALHRLRQAEIVAAAIGDKPGSETIHMPIKAAGTVRYGRSHLGSPEKAPISPKTKHFLTEIVPVVTVDGFVAEAGITRVDFIKADIEGWERRMLAGASHVLKTYRPVLLLELGDDGLSRAGDSEAETTAFLTSLGYRALAIDSTAGIVDRGGPEAGRDNLWVHESRLATLPLVGVAPVSQQ